MAGLSSDVRLGIRRLRSSPGYTLFAIASLALGIGVTTAIYSAVRMLLWMPLGVPHQSELVQIVNGRLPNASMPSSIAHDRRRIGGRRTVWEWSAQVDHLRSVRAAVSGVRADHLRG